MGSVGYHDVLFVQQPSGVVGGNPFSSHGLSKHSTPGSARLVTSPRQPGESIPLTELKPVWQREVRQPGESMLFNEL